MPLRTCFHGGVLASDFLQREADGRRVREEDVGRATELATIAGQRQHGVTVELQLLQVRIQREVERCARRGQRRHLRCAVRVLQSQ